MITLSNVTFGYRKQRLFSDLNLTIEQGRIYGLLGKNGAGKTTMLKLISGLLYPSSGKIDVSGHNPKLRQPDFLSRIFILPEEFDLPRVNMTQYTKAYSCFYPKFSQEQLQSFMKELEVGMDQEFHRMSFGQKKKAYIAFALACNTELLIMDEPTNGLDIPSKTSLRRVIAGVAQDDRTIIISTHQVRDIDTLIDSVIILDGSEILLNSTNSEITDRLMFKHLGSDESALYSEQTIHGRWGVVENLDREDSPLDIELLFNAVISSRASIKRIFSNK